MRYILLFAVIQSFSLLSYAQTSRYSGSGVWNLAANWNNGIPDATINARINTGANCNVNSNSASCKGLEVRSGGAIIVNSGGTLVVNGPLEFESGAGISIIGNMQFRGDIILNGFTRFEIGGGLEIEAATIQVTNGSGVQSSQ